MAAVATQWPVAAIARPSSSASSSRRHSRSSSAGGACSSHHIAASSAAPPPPQQQQQPRPDYDRFYGHRELSELCETVISALFACPLDSTAASVACNASATKGGRQAPRLAEFIAYALHRTRLPLAVTHQALFLLKRLKARFPAARGSSGHRLFISALMLASKASCDDTYSNKSWTIVGQGLFSLREVNQMERELFGYLGFKVNVSNEELMAFVACLDEGRIDEAISPKSAAPRAAPQPPQAVAASPIAAAAPQLPSPRSMPAAYPGFDSAASSPSLVGPHRTSVSGGSHRARHQSASGAIVSTFNSRASISGYPSAAARSAYYYHQHPHSQAAAATAAATAAGMQRSVSAQHERAVSANDVFVQSHYAVSVPVAVPEPHVHMQQHMPAPVFVGHQQQQHYYSSPSAASSCSSLRQSFSAASTGSAFSASPSPSLIGGRGAGSIASRSDSSLSSGRTTPDPDTPPSEFGDAGEDACYDDDAAAPAGVSPNAPHADADAAAAWHQRQHYYAMQQQHAAQQHAAHYHAAATAAAHQHAASKHNPTAAMLAQYQPQWSA